MLYPCLAWTLAAAYSLVANEVHPSRNIPVTQHDCALVFVVILSWLKKWIYFSMLAVMYNACPRPFGFPLVMSNLVVFSFPFHVDRDNSPSILI